MYRHILTHNILLPIIKIHIIVYNKNAIKISGLVIGERNAKNIAQNIAKYNFYVSFAACFHLQQVMDYLQHHSFVFITPENSISLNFRLLKWGAAIALW